MPPLPDNNTPVLFIDYTSRGIGHTTQLRFELLTDPANGALTGEGLIQALRPFMLTTDTFTGFRWRHAGSNITFPLELPPIGGTSVLPSDEVDPESFFFSFVARGPQTGRRFSIKFFGTRGVQARPADNRYSASESTPFAAVLENIKDLADPEVYAAPIVTIGFDTPIFQNYINVANNAYWQRAQR